MSKPMVGVWVAVFVALSGTARGQSVSFDLSPHFNADVVVNDGTGRIDPTQDPIDLGVIPSGNFALVTQSVAEASVVGAETANGLPNDGFFPAGVFHPEMQLRMSNAKDDLNARRSAASTDLFVVDVPADFYAEIHFVATSGDGSSAVRLELVHADASTSSTDVVVPNWFDDPVETIDRYRLFDGGDRMNPGNGPGTAWSYEDSNDTAVHGFRLISNPMKLLTSVRVERTGTTAVLNTLGLIGVLAVPPGPNLYEALDARTILDPPNMVLTEVTSPIVWTPSFTARCIYYTVEDGLDAPALIFVAKLAADQIEITF